MSTRSSGNSSTALRRLMTEYKQLTSGGTSSERSTTTRTRADAHPRRIAPCIGSPDGMFTAGVCPLLAVPVPLHTRIPMIRTRPHRAHLGSRLFHLGSPDMRSQRHAVRASFFFFGFFFLLPFRARHMPTPSSSSSPFFSLQDGGVFVAKLTFVRLYRVHTRAHALC